MLLLLGLLPKYTRCSSGMEEVPWVLLSNRTEEQTLACFGDSIGQSLSSSLGFLLCCYWLWSIINYCGMQCGGLNINSDWLFSGNMEKTHWEPAVPWVCPFSALLRISCACGMPSQCQLLGCRRGSSQEITMYSTAGDKVPLIPWAVLAGLEFLPRHPINPGHCHLPALWL